jgi:hypothetical protein
MLSYASFLRASPAQVFDIMYFFAFFVVFLNFDKSFGKYCRKPQKITGTTKSLCQRRGRDAKAPPSTYSMAVQQRRTDSRLALGARTFHRLVHRLKTEVKTSVMSL